jgi:hypothetical protein
MRRPVSDAASLHDPPETEPHFDDDYVCSRKPRSSLWKASFTRAEWVTGIVLGAFMGVLLLLIVWLLTGAPSV